jgi:hypothetical protein
MKTKQWIFGCAASLMAGILTLAGCSPDNTVQNPDRTDEYDDLRFVVNMAEKPSLGGDTRALKQGWADGDKIAVFFGDTPDGNAMLEYDADEGEWNRVTVDIASLPTSGDARALHADSASLAITDGNIEGIGGDLLYADGGEYTYDPGTKLVTLTLSMQRGLTSVVKMESPDGLPANLDWRLAGEGILVQTSTELEATNLTAGFTFAEALADLFEQSDPATGIAATPDPVFTDEETAVFHLWDRSAEGGTTLHLYKDAAIGIYTRSYARDIAPGESVLIAGPSSIAEWDGWEYSGEAEIVEFPYSGGQSYQGDLYANGTSVFRFRSRTCGYYGEEADGWSVEMNFITEQVDLPRSIEYLDLPEGVYPLSDTKSAGTVYLASNGRTGTALTGIENGDQTAFPKITGGVARVAKEGDVYTVTFDLTLESGEKFLGRYEGPVTIPNPNYLDTSHTMTITTDVEGTPEFFHLAGSGNVLIDWGDGTEKTFMELEYLSELQFRYDDPSYLIQHEFSEGSGTKTITITGRVEGVNIKNLGATALDVVEMPTLMILDCSDNNLTVLDLGGNYSLMDLDCSNNSLVVLDTSQNPVLRRLNCYRNQLGADGLNLENNRELAMLDCSFNPLVRLDVSQVDGLRMLQCVNSGLQNELFLSNNHMLEIVVCGNVNDGYDAPMRNMIHNLILPQGASALYLVDMFGNEMGNEQNVLDQLQPGDRLLPEWAIVDSRQVILPRPGDSYLPYEDLPPMITPPLGWIIPGFNEPSGLPDRPIFKEDSEFGYEGWPVLGFFDRLPFDYYY